MFSAGIRTRHDLFLRKKDSSIDEKVFSLFIKQNIKMLKSSFFVNNLACSWSSICMPDLYEILFVISPVNHIVTESGILKIYENIIGQISKSDYNCYSGYVNSIISGSGLLNNVKRLVADEKTTLLSPKEYTKQTISIMESLSQPFIHITKVTTDASKQCHLGALRDIEVNIHPGKLCFMGLCFQTNECRTLKEILVYKLLEKIYGTNESASIYYHLRQQGRIYTGITAYYMDKNRFLTGVMGTYCADLHEEIKQIVKSLTITEAILMRAKNNLYNELEYMVYQNGELFTLFPYYCKIKGVVTLPKVKKALELLSLEEFCPYVPLVMNSISVGEN